MNQGRRIVRGVALVGAVLLISGAALMAVLNEGLFELGDNLGTPGSGDILGSDVQPGCDWADLFDADPTEEEIAAAVEACGGLEGAFVVDQLSQGGSKDETVFAGSSSKNDDLIATWTWSTGSTPSKDDLSNFYAYATLNEAGELIFYAGVERISSSGDSHVDFELNQSLVGLDKDPPCGNDRSDGPDDGSPCEFTGEKVVNDILVVMDFAKGGDLGLLEIRQWDGTSYVLLESVEGEGCNAADTVCAFNNAVDIDGGPWDNYNSKGKVTDSIEANGFTEAGINVTALLGETPCFATLQAKTRSSSSYSSALKDFAQASFGICSIELTKGGYGPTGEPLSKIGDDFTFSYEIVNTGGAPLELESMEDSLLGDITDDATQSGCATLEISGKCQFDIVTAIPDTEDEPIETSVEVVYVTISDVTPAGSMLGTEGTLVPEAAIISSVSATDDLEINLFQPSVTVDKTGDTLSMAGNEVGFTITITNTGSGDSPDLANGLVMDSLMGDLLDPANPYVGESDCAEILPTGESCVIQTLYTVDAEDPDPLVNIVDVTYNPAGGFPNIISSSDDHQVDLVAPSMVLTVAGEPQAAHRGDTVTYTYTLENTGDVTLNRSSVVDTLLGDLSASFPASLAPDDPVATVVLEREVAADESGALINEVTAIYQVQGLENLVTETESFQVDIQFEPSVLVEKTGDPLSTVGNEVGFTITITNTSSFDTPELANGVIADSLLGDLLDAANPHVAQSTCAAVLPLGESCVIQTVYTVQAGDPDPLVNTVNVTYNPTGFPYVVSGEAQHQVDLVVPAARVTVLGEPQSAFPGEVITYTFTLQNTGDVALTRISVVDTVLGDLSASFPTRIEPGDPEVVVVLTRQLLGTDPNPLANEVTIRYQVEGLANVVQEVAGFQVDISIPVACALSPGFWKGGNGVPKWDDISTDTIAQAAGFDGGTLFPYLDSSVAGSTYLDLLNFSALGDVTRQLSFKYIAARLNQATFGVPGDTAALLNSIDVYLAANPVGSDPNGRAEKDGEALLGALNAYFAFVGEANCPSPDEF